MGKEAASGAKSRVVVAPATQDLISAAKAGDYHALSHLYGMTGALLAADGPLPEPLLSFMQERLFAIAEHLATNREDFRRGALVAIAGRTRRGVKAHAPPLLPYSTVELMMAAEVFFLKRVPGASPVKDVAAKHFTSPKVVEAAITKVRKARVTWLD